VSRVTRHTRLRFIKKKKLVVFKHFTSSGVITSPRNSKFSDFSVLGFPTPNTTFSFFFFNPSTTSPPSSVSIFLFSFFFFLFFLLNLALEFRPFFFFLVHSQAASLSRSRFHRFSSFFFLHSLPLDTLSLCSLLIADITVTLSLSLLHRLPLSLSLLPTSQLLSPSLCCATLSLCRFDPLC
jgi:hypothetical protein